MTGIDVANLRRSLEGAIPSILATCDEAGTPNVSMISQVHYVDADHVALSYQFFNKTRRNLLANGSASVVVTDPVTLAMHRLDLDYEETRTGGPVFESMKAKLAGIASHHGVSGVFRLLGADVFCVRTIEELAFLPPLPVPPQPALLPALRRSIAVLNGCADFDALLDAALVCLEREFAIDHSMILIVDTQAQRLYTVASRGYPNSGIGSEIAFGDGVIGVAALENAPIRIGYLASDYLYGAALADNAQRAGIVGMKPTEIPFPGLAAPQSQIALPIVFGDVVSGVLFAEAEEDMRFGYDDEDALAVFAGHLGAMIALLGEDEDSQIQSPPPHVGDRKRKLVLQYHPADQSVFVDHDYLIKGVAGAILWRLLQDYTANGRTDFSNRELRLDASLRLPAHAENLDARLVLLRRRLEERQSGLRIEKTGRGRFRLMVDCRIELQWLDAPGGRTVR